MKSKILALMAAAICCISCIENDSTLGGNLIPVGQLYDFYTVSVPIEEVDMMMADSLSGYSDSRITFGAVRDEYYGLSTRSSAVTLIPMFDVDEGSLDFGTDPEFLSFHFSVAKDTMSYNDPTQKNILQAVKVYELERALDADKDYDCNLTLPRKEATISAGTPIYTCGDSLSFDFSEEFGKKYMSITADDLADIDTYLAKFPGICFETEDPIANGGRINMFELQTGYDSDNYVLTGNYATLRFESEYDGERKDTSFVFLLGMDDLYDLDSLFDAASTGSFPQYALNVGSQENRDRMGRAEEVAMIEGGGGLKPVIHASELREIAINAISEKGGDPLTTVINKATIILPFEFPSDYTEMDYWPTRLSPTCKVKSDTLCTFASLTDSSSDDEDQGDIDRSLLQYSPDITYHMQELVRLDLDDESASATKLYNNGSLDIWFLIMANEVTTTTTSGSSDLSEYYNYLAYQSYYNSMYGGYSNYGSSYSNYYTYAMLAAYASQSSTTESTSMELDRDRFYRAAVNGPTSSNGRVPTLQLTFAIPKSLTE